MSFANGNERSDDIAIIGLSCRFPGDASDPLKFWDLLKNGRHGFSTETQRYNAEAFSHPIGHGKRQNIIPVKGGYLLKQDLFAFDAAFFNITAAEAMALDPRQRIAMEVAYEALENAGLPLRKVAGTQTACFMGSSMSDYRDAVARDFGQFPKYHILGVSDEMIANRISHFLDIHGPSATVQTACSSSLVATHIACQSLRSGESEMAIAGGVGLITLTDGTMHLNNLSFLNPEGHSRSFDADANGYGRGEGCGVVVLKRLQDAVRDGDSIRAVIRGSGVNSDGWTQGVTMPSASAQEALIRYVYGAFGLDFGATQYVEAHGTGTKAGDPIEATAIYRTIGQAASSSRKKLYMGSVKANIGHLEAAAGVASIIKGVLALERALIPPNLNFAKANPAIPLDEWNMVVPTKLTPWPAARTKRMSISGFGMGGTNAHVVLDAYNSTSIPRNGIANVSDQKRVFVLSSHDKAGLDRVSKTLAEHLGTLGATATSPAYLANLAYTLARARSGLSWKATLIAENSSELIERLTAALGDEGTRTPSNPPRLGFVFTGQGAQWARMGIEMMSRPVFSDSVARSTQILRELGCSWDPVTELSKEQKASRLGIPEISQPICSVLQIALVDELRSWGITPSRVVGHSSGEIAAAYSIGALSHRDALAAAYFRGTASTGLIKRGQTGGMMAVGCSSDHAQKLMKALKLEATVACINSPSSVTLSGNVDTLEQLRACFDERGIFARRLKVEVAYHSPHMHLCSAEYYTAIADVGQTISEDASTTTTKMISSVYGYEIEPEQLGAYYWVQNLINPVLFTDAVKEMVQPADSGERAIDMLVEIGPHSALGGPIEQILSTNGIKNVNYSSMLVRGQSAVDTSLDLAAVLFRQGVSFDMSKANGDSNCRMLTDLPPYAWNHSEKFNALGRIQREQYNPRFSPISLLGSMQPSMEESQRVWRGFIRLSDEPWLRDHTVGSTVVFPAAGMVSITLEAARQLAEAGKTPKSFKLRDVSFMAAMALRDDAATEITVHIRPHAIATGGSTPAAWWEFTVSSCSGPTGQMRNNCRGLISIVYAESQSAYMAAEEAKTEATYIADYHRALSDCQLTVSKEHFYHRFEKSSIFYGEVFQGVKACHPGDGQTCYEVEVLDIEETFTKGKLERPFLIHPAALDAAWQGWLGSTDDSANRGEFGFNKPMVPTFLREMDISFDVPGDVGYTMRGFCRSHKHGFNAFSADLSMLDKDMSKVFLSVTDLRLSALELDEDNNADGEGTSNAHAADITSVVQWNYSLDLLRPKEIAKLIGEAHDASPYARLAQLARIAIHQRPTVTVTELVQSHDEMPNSVISNLPSGLVLPSQIQYAIVENRTDENPGPSNVVGRTITLGDLDSPLPQDMATADLFLIAPQFDESIVERVLRTANPGAIAIIATHDSISTTSDAAACMAKYATLGVSTHVPTSTGCIFLCRVIKNGSKQSKQLTNGTHINGSSQTNGGILTNGHSPSNGESNGNGVPHDHAEKISIINPTNASTRARKFSEELQFKLEDEGYNVQNVQGVDNINTEVDSACISLLELEMPILESLSEAEFKGVQKLATKCERLLWITCGDNPSLGMVDGLARCANEEGANTRFQVLHLSELTHGVSLAARIIDSSNTTMDNEFRELDGFLQVPRVYRSTNEDTHIRNHLEDSTRLMSLNDNSATFSLKIGKPGLLDSLHFVREDGASTPLGENELELEVKATGVNFRDVMASMGLVPVMGLGQEASGIVLRAGAKAAESFQPGDRVSALSVGGMHATKTRCDYRVAAKMPNCMSFEEGAAAPMVHSTAYYTIVQLAKLRRGQSILIHAAAGGVGQAAVQLAKHLGLVVYVTVGTEDKRQFVKEQYSIPDEHIFHSRDASFAKGIQRLTGGRGVDCVLNSLSGELLRISWTCLATFGTFIEIGMRDITDNMRLDMRPFEKSATFTFFDVPTLIEQNPEALGKALNEVFALLQENVLHVPKPLTAYPVGKVEDAFRVMQQGKHRGKLVLSFDENHKAEAPVLCQAQKSLKLDPNATYLFIGGLGGLGRSLAAEFVASGARHLAFISRSGDSSPEAKAAVKELESHGAQVKAFRGDVADGASFLAVMDQCKKSLPPIKGVIQMAMVLRDTIIENMTYDDWTIPLRPKVQGSWNLHQYFGHDYPLDFMIFTSSFTGLIGNRGQAQYCAGNTYLDALAHYRRAQGLKAVSVDLGIMLDVGVLVESGSHNFGQWQDVLGIHVPAFHAMMKSVINGQQQQGTGDERPAQICLSLGHADLIASHRLPNPPWFADVRFGALTVANDSSSTGSGGDGAAVSVAAQLGNLSGDEKDVKAGEIITGALVSKLAEILRIPATEIDATQALYAYGVDSLVALEVRNWITRELKANVALLDILSSQPIEKFAVQIAQKSKLLEN